MNLEHRLFLLTNNIIAAGLLTGKICQNLEEVLDACSGIRACVIQSLSSLLDSTEGAIVRENR